MQLDNEREMVQRIKEMVRNIATEECNRYNIDIKFSPMTIIEYYKSDIFRKNLVLNSMPNHNFITIPFKHGAFYDAGNKEIALFVKNIKKINKEAIFPYFASLVYHEVRHHIQNNEIANSKGVALDTFVLNLENIVSYFEPKDYSENYDDYFSEIDADLYGINSALSYLERNGILSEDSKQYLEKIREKYEGHLKTYDFQSRKFQ